MPSGIDLQVRRIVDLLQRKHGSDILVMDLRQLTDTTDYFVICSGNSDQHLKALADELVESSKAAGDPPWHVEGLETRRWILVDFVHIVVHLFRREAREFYALERLWGDAAITRYADYPDTADSETAPQEPADLVFSRS